MKKYLFIVSFSISLITSEAQTQIASNRDFRFSINKESAFSKINSLSSCIPTISISANPSNIICAGTIVTFVASVQNEGSLPSFQWYKNGLIAGLDNSSFITSDLNNTDVISCVLTSSDPCANPTTANSNSIEMLVSSSSSLTNGLIAWYPFDGNAFDNSGNNLNGTVQGALLTTDRNSVPNSAYRFNGPGDFVLIGNPSGINNFTTGFTVAAWVYLGANNPEQAAFVAKWNNSTVDDQYLLWIYQRKPNLATGNYSTGAAGLQSPTRLLDSAWYHVVGTWDNTGRTSIYLNGHLNVTDVFPIFNVINNTSAVNLRIGAQDIGVRPFKGKIDDVRLYNRSLNSTEILNLFNGTIGAVASIAINASSTNICSGSGVTFNANITGGGSAPVYQWLVNGQPSGPSSPTFTTYDLNNGDNVSCKLISSDPCIVTNTVFSNPILMGVNPSVTQSVSISVLSTTICTNESGTFSAAPSSGLTNPFLQWKKNGSSIPGANGAFYTSGTLQDGDIITCVLSSSTSCVTPDFAESNPITMSVLSTATPGIGILSNTTTICPGSEVTFTATPTNGGSNPTYRWKINGTLQAGSTSETFVNSLLQNNDIVTCEITSNLQCASPSTALSNPITITVSSSLTPQITISNNSGQACDGDTINLIANINNGGPSPSFQWYFNGSTIGNNQPELMLTSFNTNDSVYCKLTSNDACATTPIVFSNVIHLSINLPVPPTITQVNNLLYSSSAVSYQWYINGSLIPGATQVTYAPTVPGFYQVSVISQNGCSSISSIFLVSTIGISEDLFLSNNIRLYPNPAKDEVFLEMPSDKYFQINLFSIEGKFLETLFDGNTGSDKTSSRFNTTNLTNGVYVLRISGQNGFNAIKLMVMH